MAKRKALSIGDPLVLTCQETVIFALEADATQKAQEKWKQLRERIGIDKNKTDGIVQDILKSQIESPHLVVLNRNTSGFQLSDESGKVIAYFRPSFESRKDLKDHDNHGRFGSIQFQVYGEWPTHVPINQRSLVEGKGFLLKHLIRALALDFEVRCEGYVRAFTAKDMLILTPKEEDEFLAVQEHLDKKRKIVEEQHAKTYKIELAKQLLLRMERVIEEYIKIQKEENKLIEKVKRPTLGHWVRIASSGIVTIDIYQFPFFFSYPGGKGSRV